MEVSFAVESDGVVTSSIVGSGGAAISNAGSVRNWNWSKPRKAQCAIGASKAWSQLF
jgi:hypothetical protein